MIATFTSHAQIRHAVTRGRRRHARRRPDDAWRRWGAGAGLTRPQPESWRYAVIGWCDRTRSRSTSSALTFRCRSRSTVTPERCSTSSISSPRSERAASSVRLESCAVADRESRVARQPGVPPGPGAAHIRRPAAGLIQLGVPAHAAQPRLGAELAPGRIGWLPGRWLTRHRAGRFGRRSGSRHSPIFTQPTRPVPLAEQSRRPGPHVLRAFCRGRGHHGAWRMLTRAWTMRGVGAGLRVS